MGKKVAQRKQGGGKMLTADYNATLPQNIIRIINMRGLKQCAVAKKAGFSKQQFNSMLNGRKIIKPCDALAIADALNVEMNDLYEKIADNESVAKQGK